MTEKAASVGNRRPSGLSPTRCTYFCWTLFDPRIATFKMLFIDDLFGIQFRLKEPLENCMQQPKLIILTNCSERKRGNQQALRLRDFEGDLPTRTKLWCSGLEHSELSRTPAIDLYQGDHWASILSLVRVAEQVGWETELWIASAGYGLIPAKAGIVPYAATFGSGHPDSVWRRSEPNAKESGKAWWQALRQWKGPCKGEPRSLKDLANRRPSSRWLAAMSPSYLNAISLDLMKAKSCMEDPEGLILVSGKPGPRDLSLIPNWIPTQDKCRLSLGGSCNSLNARIGAKLLRRFSPERWSAPIVQPEAGLWMAGLDPMDRLNRSRISDEEAIVFIQMALVKNPMASHTNLLRQLRAKGTACEQGRFRGLFQDVQRVSQ